MLNSCLAITEISILASGSAAAWFGSEGFDELLGAGGVLDEPERLGEIGFVAIGVGGLAEDDTDGAAA